MTKTVHRIYILIMTSIVIAAIAYLSYTGYTYYNLPLEERFYHEHHDWFKPSGDLGHGLGITGTLMIAFGVGIYIARKRYRFMSKYLRLKYLLEFHIFLCVLGPVFILFHTAFKFGGIVSIAFWSMVAVVLSGVIGRFLYIQIPRTIEGQALSLDEVAKMREELLNTMIVSSKVDKNTAQLIMQELSRRATDQKNLSYWESKRKDKEIIKVIKGHLKKNTNSERYQILRTIKKERTLSNKIRRLNTMKRLFKYWHVAHLPFALIMLVIVIIHIAVTLAFG